MNKNPNAKQSASQSDKILEWLQDGNTITAREALNKFKCFRLAARIRDLRMKGHDIVSERIKARGGKIVAQYSIA